MKRILLFIALFSTLFASAQYDSTRVWQPVNGDGFIWKNGQFNGALIFPNDTPHLKTAQRAIGFKGQVPYYWSGSKWNSFSGAGGTGTLVDFIAGNMTPFFTTNVATSTTTPNLTFTLSPSAAYTIWGNNGGSSAAPSYFTPVLASNLFANQGTSSQFLRGNAAGAPSWSGINVGDLPYAFPQSVALSSNTVTLVNDQTAPDTFQVYGTDSNAVKGYQPSQPSRLTAPQDGDGIFVQYINGRPFLVNGTGAPGAGTRLTGIPTIIDLGNLSYFMNTNGPYWINGIQYPSASGTVNLPVGNAGVDSGRIDLLVVSASGVGSIQGINSDNPQEPAYDQVNVIRLASVLILENQTVPATTSTNVTVTDENLGQPSEAALTNTGTITYNANSTTHVFHGSKSIAFTAWTQNSQFNMTFSSPKNRADYTYFVGHIYLTNGWNSATNLNVQLFNGATVTNVIQVTAYGVIKTTLGSFQTFAIPMSAFTGSSQFTGIRITRIGATGTINFTMDYDFLQSSGLAVGGTNTTITLNNSFNSVSELKASTIYTQNVTSAKTNGYYAVNDGGGAQYYWDGTSTAADDGFLVHRPNAIAVASPGRWRLIYYNSINLLWTGAKADSTTDTKPYFRKALNAIARMPLDVLGTNGGNGTIYADRGKFYFSDSLQIRTVANIIGLGEGHYPYQATQFRFQANHPGFYFLETASQIGSRDPLMENIYFKGLGATSAQDKHGIFSNSRIHLINIGASGFSGDGVIIDTRDSGNANHSWVDVYCDDNRRYGLSLWGNDANFCDIWFEGNANGGSNYHDQAFLGNRVHKLNTAFSGIRQADNLSYVHIGSTIYGCINPNINIQPGVTSGWQNYWIQQNNLPLGWTTAWNSSTTYFDAAAAWVGGSANATTIDKIYAESGQLPVFQGPYVTVEFGDNGPGPFQTDDFSPGLNLINDAGTLKIMPAIELFNRREPYSYVRIDDGNGLQFGITGQSFLSMRAFMGFGDSSVRLYAGAGLQPVISFPWKDYLYHSNFGIDTVKAGSPVIEYTGHWLTDFSSSNYVANSKMLIIAGYSLPTGTSVEYPAGAFMFYMGTGTDTIGAKCTATGRPGTWHWLVAGGGGGGSSLFPTTGTGTAIGNVLGDMAGFDFQINNGGLVDIEASTGTAEFRSVGNGLLYLSSAGNYFEDDHGTPKGLEYDADYSANYSSRSLVDKAYVDAAVAGAGGGGWGTTGTVATLTGNGTLAQSGHNFTFDDGGDRLKIVSGARVEITQYDDGGSDRAARFYANNHTTYIDIGYATMNGNGGIIFSSNSGDLQFTPAGNVVLNQHLFTIPGTTGNTIKWNATSGTPTNTVTPAGWVRVNVAGTDSWLPYYQ